MQFSLLGPLEVRRHGALVPVGSPKLRALLILLLLDVGRTVSVDRLVDDLWAGDPPSGAVVTLRSYVSNLRRALDSRERAASVLLTRGRGYALEVDPVSIDAIRFEQLVWQSRRDLEAGRLQRTVAGVDGALALWRGAPLDDVAFDNFAQGPVARLEELRLSACEDRFEALLAMGRDGQTVAELQAFTVANPLRERPRSQLMLALYRAGRAAEAMRAYTAFRASLVGELGLDPSPALADLAERILRQSPDLRLPDREAVGAPAAPPGAPPGGPGASAPGPRLVGREAEQRRAAAVLHRLDAGEGGLLLVAGAPGIGKTALLHWLDGAATARGAQVHWGRCQRTAGVPPFWPWIQVLRSIASGLDDARLSVAVRGPAGPVTQVAEDLAVRLGERHEVSGEEPHDARFALYEAVITFLRRTAPAQGSVLVLDDLHWAGTPSLELLALLAEQLTGTPVVVAAAYRDLPAERSPALDTALAALARERAELLSLTGLSRDETAVVVEAVTRVVPPADLVTAVHERTGGNPFFVHQLARLLDDSSGSRHDGRVSTAVPVGARHVITRRLQLVSEATRQLLDAAAVAGRDVDLRIASAAAGMTVDEGLDAADEAVAHGLLEEQGEAVMSYRFVHTLIRDAAYGMLTPARAARLHLAVATALERRPDPPVAALSEHFWRAADVTADDRPLRYTLDAAGQALAVHAYELAEEYVRRALHLLSHRSGDGTAGEAAIRHRLLSLAAGLLGYGAEPVAEVARRALEPGVLPATAPELLAMWWARWSHLLARGNLAGARDLAARLSCQAAEQGEPAAAAAAHLLDAYPALLSGEDAAAQLRRLAEARSCADRASEERLAAVPEHLGVCILVAGALVRALSGTAGAREAAEEAVALAGSLGRPLPEAYARSHAGVVGALEAEPRFAREVSEPGLEICTREGLRYAAAMTTVPHAWACAHLGDDAGAQARRITDAVDTLRHAGYRQGIAMWLVLLAEVRLLAGEAAAALRALDEAEAAAEQTGERVYGDRVDRLRQRCASLGGGIPPVPRPGAPAPSA